MEKLAETGLKEALSYLESGNPIQAKKVLDNSFVYGLDSREIFFTGKCCIFWQDIILSLPDDSGPFERGETILAEWKNFLTAFSGQEDRYEPAMYAVCRGVFSLALRNFSRLLDESDSTQRAEVLRKVGLCYKKLGEFDNAKTALSEANQLRTGQADVIADLADCYALCGDDKASKVLFREAFYIDFKKIDIDFLDSQLIKRLVEKTAEKGLSGDMLKVWIPVYGVIWGVFNVKRSMKSREVSRLKQEIFSLENEHKDPSRVTPFHTPRLLNLYFWLVDYCQAVSDEKLINEILLKIKVLDTSIYNLYVK